MGDDTMPKLVASGVGFNVFISGQPWLEAVKKGNYEMIISLVEHVLMSTLTMVER